MEEAITVHNGATVNGVQTDTEVIMARKGFDKWPSAKDGLAQWKAKVQAMDLVDRKVNLRDLRMNPNTGYFYREGKVAADAIPATRTAIGHLMSYVKEKPSNLVNVMLDLPPAIRQSMFQHYMARPENRSVNLRTALTSTSRVIRAVVTDVHSQETGDDLKVIESLETIADSIPQSKMRVIRQWDYTHAEIVIPNIAVQPKVGVTLYARINIENSETKGAAT
mgnify:FL=1